MSWRAFLPNRLWPNRRFAHRRVDYAAPVIPGDDELAAYCEQYVVCNDDVESVCDNDRDDSSSSGSDSSSNSGIATK